MGMYSGTAGQYLKKLCSEFKRDFTILDCLENHGLICKNLTSSSDYCYVICQKEIDQMSLKSLYLNVLVLKNKLSGTLLRDLSQCEDFDIALISPTMVREESLEDVINLANFTLFFDIGKEYLKILHPFIKSKKLNVIDAGEDYLCVYRRSKLMQRGWLKGAKKNYIIEGDFNEKFFVKKVRKKIFSKKKVYIDKKKLWQKGINLWNFVYLDGVYPSKEFILREMCKIFDFRHYDYRPWNIIIAGNNLYMIDLESMTQTFNREYRLRYLRQSLYIVKNSYKIWPPNLKPNLYQNIKLELM